MGLIDFEKCLRTTLEPAAAHPNQRRRRAAAAAGAGVGGGEEDTGSLRRSAAAAADAGVCFGGEEDTGPSMDYLEYTPAGMRNGHVTAILYNVPARSRFNKLPHGRISGQVALQVGNYSHHIDLERRLHATLKNHSCCMICFGASAMIAVDDPAFIGLFELLAPDAAARVICIGN